MEAIYLRTFNQLSVVLHLLNCLIRTCSKSIKQLVSRQPTWNITERKSSKSFGVFNPCRYATIIRLQRRHRGRLVFCCQTCLLMFHWSLNTTTPHCQAITHLRCTAHTFHYCGNILQHRSRSSVRTSKLLLCCFLIHTYNVVYKGQMMCDGKIQLQLAYQPDTADP